MEAADPILTVRGVQKSFGGIRAVDRCSLTVLPQSITGLIGPNGAGKSTLFNIIAGLYRPDGGEILFNGARIDGRAQLVLSIDKGLVAQGLDAAQVIREIARIVNGGGGGRPDFAEAGGREPEKLGEALDAGQELLVAALS